ncbi:leucine-rich repeat domain-containing protein [Capnocytophaga endodontalis]|uniref:Leucine-rich repeat domain-containing protein n=1 Tax=Capnocytophaga endodontalis TaxID=2708117 RepID=A0A1Z4BLG7_9FLAO|nr:leucine-rich repeat domain-containing protein [Capnocytophaga endodontalis]ASF42118.1 hypothetical protein CBG49_02910 [Capnocytophaga endodontalis]
MKTTFLTLMAATLAATALTGCKKDSGGDDDNVIRFTDSNLTVAVDKTAQVKLFVPSGSGVTDIKSNNTQVAIAGRTGNYLFISVKGVKEGDTTVEVKNGNRSQKAVLNVHVFKENVENKNGFKVDASTIFLKKNEVTNLRSRIKEGSGNYTMSVGNTAFADELGNFQVRGKGEGLHHEITFKDVDKNQEVKVPAYVIIPFKAISAPTELSLNSTYSINLQGVYTTTTTDDGTTNGRFDRVQMTTDGSVTAVFSLETVYDRVNRPIGKAVSGIKVTAKSVGTGSVNLINGDGQILKLNFTIKASVPTSYFIVDADGVLTVKPGAVLPPHVDIPADAKKIGREAFKDKDITSVDLKNVEEIDEDAFHGCVNLTTVTMTRVKVIGKSAFRNTKLTEIDLPASVEKIEKGAFDITNLVKVTCRATTPPAVGTSFRATNAERRVLYVPAGSIDTYASSWGTEIASYFRGLRTNGYKPYPIQ